MSIITFLLALFFSFASSIKILAWKNFIFETQLRFFKKYGLTRLHMFAVGLIELTASLLLVSSLFTDNLLFNGLGALGILFTSLGAIFFHIRFDTFKDAIPAIVTLVMSATLVLFNNELLALVSFELS